MSYVVTSAINLPLLTPLEARTVGKRIGSAKGAKGATSGFFFEMQTKELNNGRLAMIAIAGMVGQELATGAKLGF